MRGTFNRDQIIQELKRAYRDGDLVPGWDRAWLIDLDHPADAIPVSDLWSIQKRVADMEEQGKCPKRTPDFESVLIAPPVLCIDL
ncbi:hypothetical protein [Meridianimarinicoccus aquatilis]|uniref:Uncharacterized protein n=1 Tax=Meridianimarinicoccus aquatilis TaxID=2552766 RepID=A0A4R6AN66_9RHOB|nr:hypothetical protein [Fluviibacterium aquatile]TDL85801.1 hypothetical protein E2L05_14750 [Fluviibacterium aquatile]